MGINDFLRNQNLINAYLNSARDHFQLRDLVPTAYDQLQISQLQGLDQAALRATDQIRRLREEERFAREAATTAFIPDTAAIQSISDTLLERAALARDFIDQETATAASVAQQLDSVQDLAAVAQFPHPNLLDTFFQQANDSSSLVEQLLEQETARASLLREARIPNYITATETLSRRFLEEHEGLLQIATSAREQLESAQGLTPAVQDIYASLDTLASHFEWERDTLDNLFDRLFQELENNTDEGSLAAAPIQMAGIILAHAWHLIKAERKLPRQVDISKVDIPAVLA